MFYLCNMKQKIKSKNKSLYLSPTSWVSKVYGKNKLEYLSDNLISNDTWWDMMEDYGKYVEQKLNSNFKSKRILKDF